MSCTCAYGGQTCGFCQHTSLAAKREEEAKDRVAILEAELAIHRDAIELLADGCWADAAAVMRRLRTTSDQPGPK